MTQQSLSRVTARIVQTDDGETLTEYKVGGVACGSRELVERILEGR